MTQELNDFYSDFMNSVRASATVEHLFTEEAFIDEMCHRFSEAEEVGALTRGHFEGSGLKNRKIGFDAFDFGDEDGHVVLGVSHFINEDDVQTITESEALRHFALATAFVEAVQNGRLVDDIEESSAGFQVAAQLREQLNRTFKIRVYLLTNAQLSGRARGFPSTQLGDVTVEFHPWDIQRTKRVEESSLGREEIDLDLTEWAPEGIPCLRADIAHPSVSTFLAVVPGRVLAGIYRKYGSRVLESNVRSFLSVRGNVNKGIRGTLLNQPEMFLSFNNGISATATAVTTSEVGGALALVGIRDLQIVNGGQTTASIFLAEREEKGVDLSSVFVQMKLIVVAEADEAEIVPKISRYANTQNQVSDADFFSNHKFHQRMEEKSRRILAPAIAGSPFQTKWFYERTRGQFNTERSRLGASSMRQFDVEYPKSQLITKTDAARYLVSWSKSPHIVSSGAQKNFVQFAKEIDDLWSRNEAQFADAYFRQMIAKGILFNDIRTRVMKSDWYKQSPGYLANIVTYTIAKLVDALESGNGATLDLDIVWNQQSLSDDLWEFIEPIAILVREVLTDESRPVTNVTEWAKREACWAAVKSRKLPIPQGLLEYAVSQEDRRAGVRDAVKDQKLVSGIEAQMRVLNAGQRYWHKLAVFGGKLKSLTPKEQSILDIASGEKARTISEAQAQVLVAVEARLKSLGFVES